MAWLPGAILRVLLQVDQSAGSSHVHGQIYSERRKDLGALLVDIEVLGALDFCHKRNADVLLFQFA